MTVLNDFIELINCKMDELIKIKEDENILKKLKLASKLDCISLLHVNINHTYSDVANKICSFHENEKDLVISANFFNFSEKLYPIINQSYDGDEIYLSFYLQEEDSIIYHNYQMFVLEKYSSIFNENDLKQYISLFVNQKQDELLKESEHEIINYFSYHYNYVNDVHIKRMMHKLRSKNLSKNPIQEKIYNNLQNKLDLQIFK